MSDLSSYSGARLPDTAPLLGTHVQLRRLDPAAHGEDLWAAQSSGDSRLWKYLAYGPFADVSALSAHLRAQSVAEDPWFYAVVADGRARGVVSYLRGDAANGVIEIGHIWFGGALQRTPAATEAIFLLARHAFETLGVRRLEWKCDAANARSMAAAARFGFTYEGTFRQHMIVKGRNRDTAWFSILDGDWPVIARGFAAWLDPTNFDADGTQRASLAALRERAAGPGPSAAGPGAAGPSAAGPGADA
jgi:RimJ/RimL family protein N-acetyltransferase